MTDIDELAATLASLAEAFDTLGVVWAIGGSVASAFYGEPRASNDVDVIAMLDEANARRLPALLGDRFYADADMAAEAVRTHRSFNVIDTRAFVKVDIFVPAPGPLGCDQLNRRQHAVVLPRLGPLPILGAEDVVLQKLRWYRMGGEISDRQWRDIVSVLQLTRDLDDTYLDGVAQATGLTELLRKARHDATPVSPS